MVLELPGNFYPVFLCVERSFSAPVINLLHSAFVSFYIYPYADFTLLYCLRKEPKVKLKVIKQMTVIDASPKEPRKIRYVAIAGSTPKNCRKIKLLLKRTNCYCLVECFKNSNELELKEDFYLPDVVIIEISSLISLIPLNKKIERLKEIIPGIRVIVYYNMLIRYPFFERTKDQYTVVYGSDSEEAQLQNIELELERD